MEKGDETDRRHLTRYLSDPDRAAELIGRFPPDNDAADVGHRAVHHEPGFLNAEPNGLRRRDRLELQVLRHHRTRDAENADAMDIAEIVLDLFERRRRLEYERRAVAIDLDGERGAGAVADNTLHVGEIFDWLAVDGDDDVAWLETCGGSGAVGLDCVHPRAHRLL